MQSWRYMPMHKLNTIGGEFADPALEAAFQANRLPELVRHVQLFLAAAVPLNLLALVSDWHYVGAHPAFWIAIPARLCILAVSFVAFVLVGRAQRYPVLQRVVLAWEAIAGVSAGVLCASHTEVALISIVTIPAIFMLALPTRFRWTAIVGLATAVGLTASYLLPPPLLATTDGVISANLIMFIATLLVVVRANRGRRLEWMAVQDAQRANA